MAPEPVPPALDARRRWRWLPVTLAVVVVLVALAVYAMRRNAGSANAEDCETKPPPNTFAVAECDDGAAPATPAAPAPAAQP
jgi:hypothetical protein